MDTVALKADLAGVNPIDCPEVFVEENAKTYAFDYTSKAQPDGNASIACGVFDPGHPTHANQPFMTGCWLKQ